MLGIYLDTVDDSLTPSLYANATNVNLVRKHQRTETTTCECLSLLPNTSSSNCRCCPHQLEKGQTLFQNRMVRSVRSLNKNNTHVLKT